LAFEAGLLFALLDVLFDPGDFLVHDAVVGLFLGAVFVGVAALAVFVVLLVVFLVFP
jgi:hypothetical protein